MNKCQKCKKNVVALEDLFAKRLCHKVFDKHLLLPVCQNCGDLFITKQTHATITEVLNELEVKEKYHPIGHSFPRISLREGCFYECHYAPYYKGTYVIKCGILYKIIKNSIVRFEIPYYNDAILFKRINVFKIS